MATIRARSSYISDKGFEAAILDGGCLLAIDGSRRRGGSARLGGGGLTE
jgi:hypothetical protein